MRPSPVLTLPVHCRGSVAFLDPRISHQDRTHPKWSSWVAHARLSNFATRRQYSRSDVDVTNTLVRDYLQKYVTAYGESFCKPKHHSLKHLAKYLDLYGPWRENWCFPFEMFLQRLKRWAKTGGNWKTTPFTVATKWARWRAFMRRNPELAAPASTTMISSSAVLTGAELCSARSASNLLAAVTCVSAQYLSRVVQNCAEIEVGNWLLLQDQKSNIMVVARAREIMLVQSATTSSVLLYCTDMSKSDVKERSDGKIIAQKRGRACSVVINLQNTTAQLLSCKDTGTLLECRYLL